MGCAQSDPNGQIAAARIKELEDENAKLRKELKDSQKKLSKYELNTLSHETQQISIQDSDDEVDINKIDEPEQTKLIGYDQKVNENENENENEEKVPAKRKISIHPKKTEETDPFWLDIKNKCEIDYAEIKKTLPNKDFIDEEDERWKLELWSTEYGEYKLICNVSLINYNTDDWTEDDQNLLFASVSKYGLNSKAAWEKIAENLNREVEDVMNKYSQLVSIPLKKLKKMTTVRG
eukprot:316972_1